MTEEEVRKESLQQYYQELNTSTLLRIHSEGTLTDMAYSILENELILRGEPVPPRPREDEVAIQRQPILNASVDFIKQHLIGKRSLSSAFWRIGVGGTILLYILLIGVAILGNLFQTIAGSISKTTFSIFYFTVIGTWLAVSWVSIWRCSHNTNNVVWKYLARIIIIIVIFQHMYGFILFMLPSNS